MPAAVDRYWGNVLTSIKVNHPEYGAPRLHRELLKIGADTAPSERWIGQWLKDDWPKVSEEDKRQVHAFYWPESIEVGHLSAEDSGPGLELLALFDVLGIYGVRPTVRLAKWYAMVSRASPDADPLRRAAIAGNLAYQELAGRPEEFRRWEWCLAYSRLEPDLYLKALTRERHPLPLPRPKPLRLQRRKQHDDEFDPVADEGLLYVVFLGLVTQQNRERKRRRRQDAQQT